MLRRVRGAHAAKPTGSTSATRSAWRSACCGSTRPSSRSERQRYRYILVDEFQDTNHAQFELVKLLAGSPTANLTVVGDDDQSIYRFRGAALSNILGFREAFPSAPSVVLTDNFRSRQSILDAAYRLIRHNDPDRLEAREGLDKRLVARAHGRRNAAAESSIELLAFDTGSDEADAVAERIAASLRAGRRAGDHAILVRTNRDADPILRSLNMARVPWRFAGTAGLYKQPEVRLLVSFLRAVNDPEDSVSCYDLATSEMFGLDPRDVTLALQCGLATPHQPGDRAARGCRGSRPRPPSASDRSRSWRGSSPASTSTAA